MIIKKSAYFLYFLLFLLGLNYFMYDQYMKPIKRSLPDNPGKTLVVPKGMNIDFVNNVGSVVTNRSSYFLNFNPIKEKDVVRIGVFGGSFVWGDQVDDGEDFPAILNNLFKEQKIAVEVLNFGNPGYEFHQTFTTWITFGERYNVDIYLIGPEVFNFYRMNSFSIGPEQPQFLFGRYVLEKEKVKFIPVKGRSIQERMKHYYSFIPNEDYLKYDFSPPLFLQSLIGRNRTIKNPFYYYSGDWKKEKSEIYSILLNKWVAVGKPVVYLDAENRLSKISPKIAKKVNLGIYKALDRFPYFFKQHHTFAGNEVIADLYYELLTSRQTAEVLEFTPVRFDPKILKEPLNSDSELRFGNLAVGKWKMQSGEYTVVLGLRKVDGGSFLDNIFFGLPESGGDSLFVKVDGEKKLIGKVSCIHKGGRVFSYTGSIDVTAQFDQKENKINAELFWGNLKLGTGFFGGNTFNLLKTNLPMGGIERSPNVSLKKGLSGIQEGIIYFNGKEFGSWKKKKLEFLEKNKKSAVLKLTERKPLK